MKIEHLLANIHIEPRRELPAHFTENVMRHIEGAVAPTRLRGWTQRLLVIRCIRVRSTILVLGVSGLLLSGGATFAVAQWHGQGSAATYTDVATLANGDTRFLVDAKTLSTSGNDQCYDVAHQYFEIKKGADITPGQITDMVAGSCEYTDVTALFPGLRVGSTLPNGMPDTPAAYEDAKSSTAVTTQFYYVEATVKNVSQSALTVNLSNMSGNSLQVIPLNVAVKAFYDGQQIAVDSLHPGDPVQLLLTAHATFEQANVLSLDYRNPNETLPDSSIYGVVKMHHAVFGFAGQGKDFTQLVPPLGSMTTDPNKMIQEYPMQ